VRESRKRLNEGYCYRERVSPDAAGLPLLRYLSERYRHSTESDWLRHIEQGLVRIEGDPVAATHPLAEGELLTWHRPPWVEPTAPSSFAVVYRDEDVLAVVKPRGMPAMPGGGFLERTLLHRVRGLDPEASPLHRLGRGTSGLTLFTRHKTARRALTEAWKEGAVERDYLALVVGHFPRAETVLDYRIGAVPHRRLGEVVAVSPNGKKAVTRVRLLESREATSLVEVHIETGRTHQIRIHLAAAGYPLEGDPLYPRGGIPEPETTVLPGEPGYSLHAHHLGFPHPGDGEHVRLSCQPPPPLRSRVA